MVDSYRRVAKAAQREFVVQKSRFIGHTLPAETEEEALGFIADIKEQYRDASHNCYAYVVGLHQEIQRFQDDGEPGGTAGMPILDVIKKSELTNVVVVVTRYFGGILLGAGGLVRAYSQAASEAIREAGIVCMIFSSRYTMPLDYSLLGKMENFLRSSSYLLEDITYLEHVKMQVLVRQDEEEAFLRDIAELSDGKVHPIKGESLYHPWESET
ncbi:MAG: YigZ family protein [Clostridia bacterium]|jgi:uncharacterized YigZ family protein